MITSTIIQADKKKIYTCTMEGTDFHLTSYLALTMLQANSTDAKLIFLFFFFILENRICYLMSLFEVRDILEIL